jgi:holliday junction DNA helicase RuvB
MALKDQILSTGVSSLAQLLGHGVRLRRSPRALPEPDDSAHREAVKQAEAALKTHGSRGTNTDLQKSRDGIPPRLFDAIVGHEITKRILRRALLAPRPVHVLLIGPPGSGKTQFLQAIARLPNARYATGPTISSSGLFTYLLDHPACRFLIIDEIEKATEGDLYMLLTLMESGKITRLQHRAIEEEERTVWVFAAANDDRALPEPLRARFVRLELHAYTEAEAAAVIELVLIKREGVKPARAREIAAKVAARSRDPRDAVQVARLTQGGGELEPVLDQVMGEQSPSR